MREYIGRHRPAYTPEEVVRLANVFDEAWRILGAGDGLSETDCQERRLVLARRIVELAEGGLHNDTHALRDAVLGSA
jgi:hypothetical protein